MAAPGAPEKDTARIDSVSYFVARDNRGEILHRTVSAGQELKETWDFTRGSNGMGETVKMTDAGYYFTENMDLTKRGLRLSPLVQNLSGTITAVVPLTLPPVFWEAQHPTEGIRFLYAAYNASSTQFIVRKTRIADGAGIQVVYTSPAASYPSPGRPVHFNGAWCLPVDLLTTNTDTEAWQVRLDSEVGDDHDAYATATTTAEALDATETGVDVVDATSISVNDIIAVEGERMLVTAKNTNTLTVTRGHLDTVAVAHASGVAVENATDGTHFGGDGVSVTDVARNVAIAFLLDQTSGTPTIARVLNVSTVSAAATKGSLVQKYATQLTDSNDLEAALVLDANWTDVGDVGERSTRARGAASHAGMTIIGKTDNAYAYDKDGSNYPVIPTLNQFVDIVNPDGRSSTGSGTIGYGTEVFYPHPSGLWLISQLSRVKNVSFDQLPYYSATPVITPPIQLRFLEGYAIGNWVYYIYTEKEQAGTTSWLMALRFQDNPANDLGVVWHTLLKRSAQMRGAHVTQDMRFVWLEEGATNYKYIQLAPDGSPDSLPRGPATGTAEWYGPEVDFGLPEITKQLRYAFIEAEGGVSTCSLRLKAYRDDNSVETVGSAFTTESPINLNWTVGTTDTCRRFRPRLTATTTNLTSTQDPRILRLTVYARSADVMRLVLTPKNRRAQRGLFEMTKTLRKLKDAGPITIREPQTNESFTGYIRQVNMVHYEGPKGPEPGVEIIYERFAAAA